MKKIVGVLTVIYLMGFSSIQVRDIDVVVDAHSFAQFRDGALFVQLRR